MMTLVVSLLACGAPPEASPEPPTVAPAAGVTSITAEALRTEMFGPAPRTRLYNVWAAWCAPCREEMPRIKAWSAEHPDVEVVLVNVDLVKARKAKVIPFLRKHGLLHFRNLQLDHPDPSYALSQIVPNFAFALPLTIVVDPSGEVKHRFDRVLRDRDLEMLP